MTQTKPYQNSDGILGTLHKEIARLVKDPKTKGITIASLSFVSLQSIATFGLVVNAFFKETPQKEVIYIQCDHEHKNKQEEPKCPRDINVLDFKKDTDINEALYQNGPALTPNISFPLQKVQTRIKSGAIDSTAFIQFNVNQRTA